MLTIHLNGESHALAAATIAALVEAQGFAGRRGVAVAVNGEVVPAATWKDRTLAQDDEVEIVRPIGGG